MEDKKIGSSDDQRSINRRKRASYNLVENFGSQINNSDNKERKKKTANSGELNTFQSAKCSGYLPLIPLNIDGLHHP